MVVADDAEVRDPVRGAPTCFVHTLRPAEAAAPGPRLRRRCTAAPRAWWCARVTPFGQDGPWADYLADDLVLMALGGSMAACGYGPGPTASTTRPPLASHGDQAWRTAATYAAIAVLAALAWRGGSRARASSSTSRPTSARPA